MKRTVALVTAALISAAIFSATAASAQAPAPADTTRTPGDSPAAPAAPAPTPGATTATPPAATPAAAAADTAAGAAARMRRETHGADAVHFILGLGIGSAINYKPESFQDHYDPSFGLMLALGARRAGFTATATFDYNFFMSSTGGTLNTNDLNILTIFADLKYMPMHSTARPYLLVCGGLFRQWVVDTDYTESVLGYGGGVGVELELDRVRRLFLEGRYIQGQTRQTEQKANTEVIPFRLGVIWEIR